MSFVPNTNLVMVKPDKNFDGFKLKGGIELLGRTDLSPEVFCSVTGTVVSVPEQLTFNGHKTNDIKAKHVVFKGNRFIISQLQQLNGVSTNFDVPMELEDGDKVYFNYIQHEDCKDAGRVIEIDNESYYFIPYDQLYLAKRGSEIIMLNGYVLVEPLGYHTTDLYSPSGIKIKLDETENKPGLGKVRHVGSLCGGYLGYPRHYKDIPGLMPGDIIVFNKSSDIPLEYPFLETFDGQSRFFQMQRKEIHAIVQNQ